MFTILLPLGVAEVYLGRPALSSSGRAVSVRHVVSVGFASAADIVDSFEEKQMCGETSLLVGVLLFLQLLCHHRQF